MRRMFTIRVRVLPSRAINSLPVSPSSRTVESLGLLSRRVPEHALTPGLFPTMFSKSISLRISSSR